MRFESLDGPGLCDHLNNVLAKAFPGLVSELDEDGISEVKVEGALRLQLTFADHSDAEARMMTDHIKSVLPETMYVESISCTRASLASDGGSVNRDRRPVALA